MIKYTEGWEYQLVEDYDIYLPELRKAQTCGTSWLHLSVGKLTVKAGYAWDGPSGPAIDTKNFMRGSLVHDALYQLLRLQMLPYSYRLTADQILRKICLEDGMSSVRAWWVYQGVRFGGDPAARPSGEPQIMVAP